MGTRLRSQSFVWDVADEAAALALELESRPDLTWLKRGSPVPTNTVTGRFNAHGGRVARAERDEGQIDVLDWLGGRRSSIVTEEVLGLGRFGKTLTVLTSRKIGQQAYADEGDNEDDFVERWTPRFKK